MNCDFKKILEYLKKNFESDKNICAEYYMNVESKNK